MSADKGCFKLPDYISDVRVSPVMSACTRCGVELPEQKTAIDGSVMLLFVQCAGCNSVFIQECADFDPPQKGLADR